MSKDRTFKYINKLNDKDFSIITYNILAPVAEGGHENECPKDCLNWRYRFENIKKEIMNLSPDIVFLQETQTKMVNEDIRPYFSKNGYKCYYNPQKGGRKNQYNVNFGVMILIKNDRYKINKVGDIDYQNIYKKYIKSSFYEKANGRFASLVLIVRDKKENKDILLVNVHLESKPKIPDVKNLQAYIVMKYIEKIGKNIPVILGGDFNSKPDSSVYSGITTGKSTNKYEIKGENIDYIKPFICTPNIFSNIPLKSTNKVIFKKEPLHSNYTSHFKSTLDYIFINDKIKTIGALEEVNIKYIKKYVSIPNYDYPSDHFMQCAKLRLI